MKKRLLTWLLFFLFLGVNIAFQFLIPSYDRFSMKEPLATGFIQGVVFMLLSIMIAEKLGKE